jgi:hypothetical protein
VYKVKNNMHRALHKHKARPISKGYEQQHQNDYDKVFVPMAGLESVWVLLVLVLAASARWDVDHMDVKSALINSELEEEVYVQQPPGFATTGKEHLVLRLDKALYNLKKVPRAGNTKLDSCLVKLSTSRNASRSTTCTSEAQP